MPKNKSVFYLMMGYPGAGKTTTAKMLAKESGAHYISSDETRRKLFPNSNFSQAEHDELYEKLDTAVMYLLSQGKSVVYDANLNRLVHRQEKYEIAKKLGIKPVLIWVKAPRTLAKSRRVHQEPQHDLTPEHETPDEMFERIADVFESPTKSENADTIDGQNVTREAIIELIKRHE